MCLIYIGYGLMLGGVLASLALGDFPLTGEDVIALLLAGVSLNRWWRHRHFWVSR